MCEPWLFQGEYLCLLEPLPEHMLQEHNGTDSCFGTKRVGDEGVSRKGRGSDGKGRCLPMGTDFAAGLGCQKGLGLGRSSVASTSSWHAWCMAVAGMCCHLVGCLVLEFVPASCWMILLLMTLRCLSIMFAGWWHPYHTSVWNSTIFFKHKHLQNQQRMQLEVLDRKRAHMGAQTALLSFVHGQRWKGPIRHQLTFKLRVSGSQIHDVRQTCVDSFLRSRFCSMICFVAGHRTLYVAELQKLDVQYILTEIARTYGWNAWTANGYLMFNNILSRALQVSLQSMCHFWWNHNYKYKWI